MNSYTNHIRNNMHSAKHQVMKLLCWTEMEYAAYQEKNGRLYLQYYIPKCPDMIDTMVESRIFWNWFKNQWLMRDEIFIRDLQVQCSDVDFCRAVYQALNHPDRLVDEVYPSGMLMQNGYAVMIGELNKSMRP